MYWLKPIANPKFPSVFRVIFFVIVEQIIRVIIIVVEQVGFVVIIIQTPDNGGYQVFRKTGIIFRNGPKHWSQRFFRLVLHHG